MGLYENINQSIVNAMKNKNKDTLSTLRLLKSAIDLNKINNKLDTVTDELVVEVTSKQVKTHKESIIEFDKAGRTDLSDKLRKEIEILENYLPKQLSEEEINAELDKIFDEIKPSGKSDLGKVMKEANTRLKGKADFKLVSEIVQNKLNS